MNYIDMKDQKYLQQTVEFLNKRYKAKFHLQPTGQYTSHCPVHSEGEASFRSYIKKGQVMFHCFGQCASDYDVYNIIMLKEGVDFRQAIKIFADFLEVEVSASSSKKKKALDNPNVSETVIPVVESVDAPPIPTYHEEFEYAANLYHGILMSGLDPESPNHGKYDDIFAYLTKRGFNIEMIKAFGVCTAPPFRDEDYYGRALTAAYIDDKSHNISPLVGAGLIELINDDNKPFLRKYVDYSYTSMARYYADTLRDRIIFPIKDVDSNTVAFLGRRKTPRNKKDRYRHNTGANKKLSLWGVDVAAANIRKYKTVIICEGIFDAVRLINASGGMGNSVVVATMGASFSPEQAGILEGLGVENYVFAYDADKAGFAGLRKAVSIVKGNVFKLVVWRNDPADYFEHGIEFLANTGGLQDDLYRIAEKNKNRPASWIESGRQYSMDILAGNVQFIIAPAAGAELYQAGEHMPVREEAINIEVKVDTENSAKYYYPKTAIRPLLQGGKTNPAGKGKADRELEAFLQSPITEGGDTFYIYADFIRKGVYKAIKDELRVHLYLWMLQQEGGYITLPDSVIAKRLGMDRVTFNRRKKSLESKGFLDDKKAGLSQPAKKRLGKNNPVNKYSVRCFPKTVKPLLLGCKQPATLSFK